VTSAAGPSSPASPWSAWAEATEIQREYFHARIGHRAWSRTCGGCGEGDYLARKHKPTNEESAQLGSRFPKLPEPIVEGVRPVKMKTPRGRAHTCKSSRVVSDGALALPSRGGARK